MIMVISVRVLLGSGDFLTSEVTLAPQDCSVELVVGSTSKTNRDASCHLIQHLQVKILNYLPIA